MLETKFSSCCERIFKISCDLARWYPKVDPCLRQTWCRSMLIWKETISKLKTIDTAQCIEHTHKHTYKLIILRRHKKVNSLAHHLWLWKFCTESKNNQNQSTFNTKNELKASILKQKRLNSPGFRQTCALSRSSWRYLGQGSPWDDAGFERRPLSPLPE